MSIFSSIGTFLSSAAKKVGGAVSTAVKSGAVAVKNAAISVAKTQVGQKLHELSTGYIKTMGPIADLVIPGVGSGTEAANDFLGNMIFGGLDDPNSDTGADMPSDVSAAAAAATSEGEVLNLGQSPVAAAAAAALTQSSARGFLGIGDGQPGVFGIGDGKPGILGIGTGKNKAAAEAAEVARAQAEAAAKGAGLEPLQVKLAGQQAATKAAAASKAGESTSSETSALPWLIGGLLALFAL